VPQFCIGVAHVTAPEVAEAILARDDHVAITPEADVWALGASLWWSWTRTTAIAYNDPVSVTTGGTCGRCASRTTRPVRLLTSRGVGGRRLGTADAERQQAGAGQLSPAADTASQATSGWRMSLCAPENQARLFLITLLASIR
jgi:hypothetical protein